MTELQKQWAKEKELIEQNPSNKRQKGDGSLEKDVTSFDDAFDAFRLRLLFWH